MLTTYSRSRKIGTAASVTPWEVVAVLAWWSVILAAPVMLVRRWRRPPGKHRRRVEVSEGQPQFPATRASPTRGPTLGKPLRLPLGTLEPLCRYVDFHRRLSLAVSELELRLAVLPRERWRVEPYPLTGERQNTLLAMGERGVFVISATYAPGHFDDVITVSRLARKIELLLPGYPGEVTAAICFPFSAVPPRLWYRADGGGDWVGAWVLGGDAVIEWLADADNNYGLSAGDLMRFDELAKPNWLKAAIPTAPSWPPLQPRRGRMHNTDGDRKALLVSSRGAESSAGSRSARSRLRAHARPRRGRRTRGR